MTTAATDAPPTFCPQLRRRYVLVAAILASALGFIDGSVVAIAIPAMRETLGAGLAEAQWISNAYMLTLSSLILVGGALGDRFGLKRVFEAGIALFVVASVACALAPDPWTLIVARAVQGIGAAAMVPGSLAIISKAYPKEERGAAIGVWAAASALTTAIGPVLGGILLSAGPPELWRAIFAINLPLGGLALWMLMARVPPDEASGAAEVDWLGGALATAGLGALAWGLTGAGGEHGGGAGLAHMAIWLPIAAGLLAALIWRESVARHPMMPLRLFASATFSAANLLTFLLYFALSAVLFFLPMALIAGWGLTEGAVAIVFAPLTVFIAGLSQRFGRLGDRIGPRPVLAAGCAIVGLAYAGLAIGLPWQAFWAHVLPMMCLMGFGMSLVVAPLSAAVMGAVEDADTGAASGINNAVSRIAGLVAVAAMGGVAAAGYAAAGGAASFGAPAGGAAHLAASNAGLALVAWVTAGLSWAAAAVALVGIRRG